MKIKHLGEFTGLEMTEWFCPNCGLEMMCILDKKDVYPKKIKNNCERCDEDYTIVVTGEEI